MMEIHKFMEVNHETENTTASFVLEKICLLKNQHSLENKPETSFIHHWKLPYDK
jgi:hypothetical protein